MSDQVQVPAAAPAADAAPALGGAPEANPAPQATEAAPAQTGTESGQDIAGWARSLKGKYQTHDATKQFESVTDLFERYLNMQAPDPDASQERWDAYYNAMGRPESPDDYELPQVSEQMPNGEEFSNWFREWAHSVGLSNRQARQAFEKFGQRADQSLEAARKAETERKVEGMEKLRGEWGDKYDGRLELANRTYQSLTSEEARTELAQLNLLENPAIIKMFADLGDLVSEDALPGGRPAGSGEALEPIDPATGYRRIVFKD